MARKPTEYVQLKLRIRESLRRKLARAAQKEDRSANAEAVKRLEDSFDLEDQMDALTKKWSAESEIRSAEFEERAKRRAEQATALRDSQMLTMMLGNNNNVELLRVVIH